MADRSSTPGRLASLRTLPCAVVAGLLAMLGSANTLLNGFTYDDLPIIVQNPAVTGTTGTAQIWMHDYWWHTAAYDPNRDLLYRPLTLQTYRMNHALHGTAPFGYHLVNVLLHGAVTALVVVTASAFGFSSAAALAAGLIFAVLPIHTEAVASVVGRAELLVAVFTLIATWAALSHAKTSAIGCGFIVLVGVLGAALAKENGVVAAVLGVACAAIGGCHPDRKSRRQALLATTIACVLAIGPYLALRHHALGGRWARPEIVSKISNLMVDATAEERIWGTFQLLGMYVAKTALPAGLCMDYSYASFALADRPWDLHVLIGVTFGLLLVAGGYQAWRRGYPGASLCCLAVLLCYLPVSNALVLINIIFAERLWYLPSVFLAVILGAVVAMTCTNGRREAWAGAALTVLLVAGLVRGWIRNADWRDNETLFASAHRVHPNSAPVLYCYGNWLTEHGQAAKGIPLLERCVRIAPGLNDAQVALGRAWLRMGDFQRALRPLQTAAMQLPSYPDLQELLGQASAGASAATDAELKARHTAYEQAPDNVEALTAYTDALVAAGRVQEALAHFDSTRGRFVERAEFHRAEAGTLMLAGQKQLAIESYRRALQLAPQSPDTATELAMALLDRGGPQDRREAAALIDRAYQLAPGDSRVLTARAELLALDGRRDEAVRIYRRLLKFAPSEEIRAQINARLATLDYP